jgi:hypothetical protein
MEGSFWVSQSLKQIELNLNSIELGLNENKPPPPRTVASGPPVSLPAHLPYIQFKRRRHVDRHLSPPCARRASTRPPPLPAASRLLNPPHFPSLLRPRRRHPLLHPLLFLLIWQSMSASHPSPSTAAYCAARQLKAPPPHRNRVEKPLLPLAMVRTTPPRPFLEFGPRLTSTSSLQRCRTRHCPTVATRVPPPSKNATVTVPLCRLTVARTLR